MHFERMPRTRTHLFLVPPLQDRAKLFEIVEVVQRKEVLLHEPDGCILGFDCAFLHDLEAKSLSKAQRCTARKSKLRRATDFKAWSTSRF
eukprot:6474655-Amphidinium_carterae.3